MSTETLIKHHHDAHAEHGHHDAGANKVFGFWIYL
ncbi:MAG: cytochrome o ubiquinol oxidase subunit III, partial [Pantoea agglomerans]